MTEEQAQEIRLMDRLLGSVDPYAWYDAALKVYDGEDAGRVSQRIERDLLTWNDETWMTQRMRDAARNRLVAYLHVLRETIQIPAI